MDGTQVDAAQWEVRLRSVRKSSKVGAGGGRGRGQVSSAGGKGGEGGLAESLCCGRFQAGEVVLVVESVERGRCIGRYLGRLSEGVQLSLRQHRVAVIKRAPSLVDGYC